MDLLPPVSRTASTLSAGGIREVMELSATIDGCLHLEVGQPDFDTPAHIVDAAVGALKAGNTKYIPNAGQLDLRRAIAAFFERSTGTATTVDQVMATVGAVSAITSTVMALTDPGDDVLVPDPCWPNYKQSLTLTHTNAVHYRLRSELGFVPAASDIKAALTPRTRVLMLNSPSNPAGAVIPPETLEEIMEVAREANVWVLSDEIYGQIVFDAPFSSAVCFDSDDRAIVVSGVSKSYSMTGFRVGFVRARPNIITMLTRLQEPLVSCGVGCAQSAAAAALNGPQDCVEMMRLAYRARRDAVLRIFREHGREQVAPGGAFYLAIDVSSSGLSGRDFCLRLLKEKKVAVAPGDTFGDSMVGV